MAELLSREKELFKINQELNLLTLSSATESLYPAKGSPRSTAVTVPRYATFQKHKGPSSLLRKKGVATAPTKPPPTGRDAAATGRGVATSPQPDTNLLTKSKAPDWKQTKTTTVPTSPTSRFVSRFSTFTRDVSSKTATYVKYRNPNFSESPSLDELLRNDVEETARQKQDVVEVEVTQKRESTTIVNGQGQVKKQVTKDNFIK